MRYLNIAFLQKTGGQIDELVSVSVNLSPNEIKNSDVILDFATRTVTKCNIQGQDLPLDFEPLREYYQEIYPNLVQQLELEAGLDELATKPAMNRHQRRAAAAK